MFLRIDGDDLIRSDVNVDDEELFLEINPDFIKCTNIPYSISGFYKFEEGTENLTPPTFLINEERELEALKNMKMDEVESEFEYIMEEGSFTCSLGFNIDNRRGNNKDDKDNVSSLIDLNNEPIYFKDTDNNFQILTVDDLKIMKTEMIQDGLSKYQWKWTKQNEIMSTTTLDELDNIII